MIVNFMGILFLANTPLINIALWRQEMACVGSFMAAHQDVPVQEDQRRTGWKFRKISIDLMLASSKIFVRAR